MKKEVTKLFVCLAACLCCALFSPVQAEAEEFSPALEIEKEEDVRDNHEYYLKEREYATFEEAIEEFGRIGRYFGVNRKYQNPRIYIPYKINTETGAETYLREDEYTELSANDAFIHAVEAIICEEETGNPNGGGFLREEFYNLWGDSYHITKTEGGYQGVYRIIMNGNTTQERYEKFQKETAELIESLDLKGKTNYDKVIAIGDWLQKNIKYEYAKERGASIGVSAWKYRTCDCTGYTALFYYLGTLSGLDVLYDEGASGTAQHAWNLVKMEDGKYYGFDAQVYHGPNKEFLRFQFFGTKDPFCYSSLVEEYAKKYDIAEDSYFKEHSVCKGNHDMSLSGWMHVCDQGKEYQCAKCSYTYYEPGTGDAHMWDNGRKVVTQKADCEHPEITTWYCGYNFATRWDYDKKHPTKQVETKPALGHDLTTEVLEATCTEPRREVTTCSRCDYREVKELGEALGHDYQMTEIPATCTKEGKKVYTCTRCKDSYTESGAPATGKHSYEREVKREPFCEIPGWYHYTCADCGDSYEEYPEALGHDYAVKETIPATCEEDEKTVYECRRCGGTKTETKEGTATGHKWGEWVTEWEPTCTEEGLKAHTCEICNVTMREDIPALGHGPYEVRDQKDPGCETDGSSGDTYCKTCNKLIEAGKPLPALGHAFGDGVVTKEPTYTEAGTKEYTCSVCKKTKQVELPPLTHEHNGFEILTVQEPTCKQAGIERHQCMKCDFYYDVEIPKTGHGKPEIRGAKEATCKESGYSGDKVCSVCGAVLESGHVLEKLEHSFDAGVVNREPKCKEGTRTYTCRLCGETKTETLPPLVGHFWGEGEETKPATCTEEGERRYTCRLCGETKTEPIPKRTEHIWDEGKETKPATCGEAGEKLYTCKACKATKTEPIPATGEHHWEKGEVKKPASCTEAGIQSYHCSVCQEEKEETIAKTGHDFGEWKTVSKATIFAPAIRRHTCRNCQKTEEESYGRKLAASATPNAASLKLKTKQSTRNLRITLSAGDTVQSWASSNSAVVKVTGSANGTCTIKAGKKTGTARITITTKAGAKTTVTVKVQKGKVTATSIKGVPRSITLKKGGTYKLSTVVSPITCTDKVKFSSSKKKVATVSKTGVIRAKKAGTAKITVKAGKKKVTCKVIVR